MADSPRPVLQLFDQLFGEEQQAAQNVGLKNLRTYLEKGGSIFPLVERGVEGLISEQQMSAEDALRFLRRANSMATYLRRRFIERKPEAVQGEQALSNGLLEMVPGPKFERLFKPGFDNMCPPQALESFASPVAYLIYLLGWILFRIEAYREGEGAYDLHQRRCDLKPLLVDFNAVYRPVSSVDLIISVLEKFIVAQSPKTDPVPIEDALIAARYPNGLPYYQHWVTIDGIARLNERSVGDFAHTVDLSYPYFLDALAWDGRAERALAHASRLGPYQRELLTEPAADFTKIEAFYRDNFGAVGVGSENLNQVQYFADVTKLDTPGVERLLSIHDFAPVRSVNVDWTEAAPTGPESSCSGSVYINANAQPGIHILTETGGPSFLHRLSVAPGKEEGLQAFDRMNRMVRLCNWLELPSDQVDALLVAAIRAEVRGGADKDAWWISSGVVHALGLFQTMRERYNCTAADFAVLVDQLSIYGRGEALSQFDQVFNRQGGYREPLRLDNGTFPVTPAPGEVNLTINQLCNGLGIDTQTYQYLALAVAGAHGITNNTFKRSLPIISSFYRLVRLSRLLGITPVEGVLMLTILGGEVWLNGVAGEPEIDPIRGISPDVLNIIDALQGCVQWCRDNDLPVLWVLQHAAEPSPAREASDQDLQLFDQMRNLLQTAKFSNAAVLMAGLPPAGAADWLDFLTSNAEGMAPVVDVEGLVLAPEGTPEQYLIDARKRLEWAIDSALGLLVPTQRTTYVDALLEVLVDTRDAQISLVKETLAVYAGIEVEQAIPVLNWSNATVYQLLQQVNARLEASAQPSASSGRRNANSDALLGLLAEVRRRSDVVARLGLSAAAIQDYLDYGYKAWLDQPDKYAFTVRTLYHLTTLTRAFALSTQPPQQLLDYLRQVNSLPDPLGAAATRLAQQASAIRLAEFFDWSAQEVRECFSRVDPNLQILKNLTQLALLMRVRELSTASGMDALTIFLIGNLPEDVDKVAYGEAAELALLSESGVRAPQVQVAGDLAQLVSITCTVEPTEIVAGSGAKTIFTVTLKDPAGKPLNGVRVHFRASLGSIKSGFTGPDGIFKADYIAGTETGTDTPTYWLDLFEPENAPVINLISDGASLEFIARLLSPVPLETVPWGQEVELYATLKDRYGNLGKDELVDWAVESDPPQKRTQAIIRPSHGRTNQEGLTRVFVSSPTGGTFRFSVLCQRNEKKVFFEPITFAGEEPAQ
ncbi:hypothetical protein PS718_00690 [Pseudomonas fluorescens]|uniref:Virulence plasmid 28 protein n=1 Tax=Pseudomonas fluorescens TaxID=294 RepID=A0A5E7AA73_PSEFL|nr:Tc toxin subunit A [Pseudomonas fluorescens]VVN75220.1 hypothetical protein PS718_00690 [Pseudomonas fluorescens]